MGVLHQVHGDSTETEVCGAGGRDREWKDNTGTCYCNRAAMKENGANSHPKHLHVLVHVYCKRHFSKYKLTSSDENQKVLRDSMC